jgi:Cu/Ag efflux protein CusF
MTHLPFLALLGFACSSLYPVGGCASARVAETSQSAYAAKGVVKSFGPDRAFVNIAHEEIPGYMAAMTMSFEPERPAQLAGLSVGDRVGFRFVETPDARRVLLSIAPVKP